MPRLDLTAKLALLADAAKYDASCASSGTTKRHSLGSKGIGSTEGSGICHAYAPDGRCISLLKILLTNYCMYDCLYCINRRSSNVARARFTVPEVIDLTLDFYKRNYIEGLFLSSGIIRSPDYTMEQLVLVARRLRERHDFRGYIHLKTIPDAAPELIEAAGRFADRLSINVELPLVASLRRLAPEKDSATIDRSMAGISAAITARQGERVGQHRPPAFAPAGQSTQMIVGADPAKDAEILARSDQLYRRYRLRRVYYSAFSPIPDSSTRLPPSAPPLLREHRLYQADWLLRFYGFERAEILAGGTDGMLDLAIDPKLAWALKHRAWFPVDVNRAAKEALLRVPGLGVRVVKRILAARRWRQLRLADLHRLSRSIAKAMPFLTAVDWQPGRLTDQLDLGERLRQPARQLELLPT